MVADELRRAVTAAPIVRLRELAGALWKAFGAGLVTEEEAQSLAVAIEARKAVPATAPAPRRRSGPRPRSPASVERRRRWTASGWLPPAIAARFTMGETAALAVVAAEVAKSGRCALALDAIAAIAGVGRSTAKNAIRQARALGLIVVEHRPSRPFRHLPNVVRVVSPEWQSWVSMRRSGQGVRSAPATNTDIHSRKKEGRASPGSPSLPRCRQGSAAEGQPSGRTLPEGVPQRTESGRPRARHGSLGLVDVAVTARQPSRGRRNPR